jgi:hypothetical protein
MATCRRFAHEASAPLRPVGRKSQRTADPERQEFASRRHAQWPPVVADLPSPPANEGVPFWRSSAQQAAHTRRTARIRTDRVILLPALSVENMPSTAREVNLNKISLILLMSLAAGGVYAQGAGGGVTSSTDPAKAAAVEQHAQELQAQQSKAATSKPAATHTSTGKKKAKTSTTHKSTTTKPATAPKT